MNSHKVFCFREMAETLDREIESRKICLAILNFLMHPNMQFKERLLYSKKIYCHRHADCPISSRVLYMIIAVASKKRRICRCINQKQKIVWCLRYSSPLKSSDFTSFYFLHRGGTAAMLILSKVSCCDLRHYKKQSPGGVLLRRCRSIFFNGSATLFKTRLWHRCCSANYAKFLRTLFLRTLSNPKKKFSKKMEPNWNTLLNTQSNIHFPKHYEALFRQNS